MELAAGTQVERYTLVRPLGAGGLATVHLVRHDQIGSLHALKVLTAPSRAVRERFLREARVQGTLRHPNVVAVTDVVDVDGVPGLVLEYVNGPTLGEFLARHRPTRPQVDLLARGILRAVAAAHRAGLVHRDLKPANVLLQVTDGSVVPKVSDFGLAKILQSAALDRTRSGVVLGTPSYMAPEQIRDSGSVDARADVFALGALLYELCTGRRAFPGTDVLEIYNAVASGKTAPIRQLAPDLPEPWYTTVERCLALDPAARFADAQAVFEAWTFDQPSIASGDVGWDPEVVAIGLPGSLDETPPATPRAAATISSGLDDPRSIGRTVASALSERPPDDAPDAGPAGPKELGLAAGLSALVAVPFLLGAVLTPGPEIPGLLGPWFGGLLVLAVAAAGVTGGLARWTFTGGRTPALFWWLAPSAVVSLAGQLLTLGVVDPLRDGVGGDVTDRAQRLAQGLQVATAADQASQALEAMVLGAVCMVAAASVMVRAGLPGRVTWRQIAILAIAVVGGTALWLPATVHADGGPLPFLVFVILVAASVDLAATTRPIPPERDGRDVRRLQLVVVLASVLSVWASAKSAFLDDQLFQFERVVREAPADRFLAAERRLAGSVIRAAPLAIGWLSLSLVMGIVAAKGLRAQLRAFAWELLAVAALGAVVLPVDLVAFDSRIRAAEGLVTAFLEESVHRSVGTSVSEVDGGVVVDEDGGGLRRGDRVVFVDGRGVERARDVATALHERPQGGRVRFTVTRDGRQVDVDVPTRP